jgi:hypothetical protein
MPSRDFFVTVLRPPEMGKGDAVPPAHIRTPGCQDSPSSRASTAAKCARVRLIHPRRSSDAPDPRSGLAEAPDVGGVSGLPASACLLSASASRLSVSTSETVGNPVTPALQGGTLGKSTVENVADLVGSAWCTAWREATEPAHKSFPKR